jgi:hypothetical protein
MAAVFLMLALDAVGQLISPSWFVVAAPVESWLAVGHLPASLSQSDRR